MGEARHGREDVVRRWPAVAAALALGAAMTGTGASGAGQATASPIPGGSAAVAVTTSGPQVTLHKGQKQLVLAGGPVSAAEHRQQSLRPHLTTPHLVTATMNVSYTDFPPEA